MIRLSAVKLLLKGEEGEPEIPQIELQPDKLPKQSLGVRILDLIESKGSVGMTTTQIKKALYEMAYPDRNDWDAKKYRGWWSDPLYGGMHSKHGIGLLKFFCKKSGKRWVRNTTMSHGGKPWVAMSIVGRWNVNYAALNPHALVNLP